MAMKTTRWRPDTCRCVLEYQWDDTTELDKRILSASKIVSACPAHQGISKVIDHYDTVRVENTRKNLLIKNIMADVLSATTTVFNENGEPIQILKSGKDIICSYNEKDVTRTLRVELVGFSSQEKASITNLAKADSKISIVSKAV